jgi:hypothetical protein
MRQSDAASGPAHAPLVRATLVSPVVPLVRFVNFDVLVIEQRSVDRECFDAGR